MGKFATAIMELNCLNIADTHSVSSIKVDLSIAGCYECIQVAIAKAYHTDVGFRKLIDTALALEKTAFDNG